MLAAKLGGDGMAEEKWWLGLAAGDQPGLRSSQSRRWGNGHTRTYTTREVRERSAYSDGRLQNADRRPQTADESESESLGLPTEHIHGCTVDNL